jgi:hypothetical protein
LTDRVCKAPHARHKKYSCCTKNSVRVDYVSESPNVSAMIALFCLCLALLASPFKSKSRLETENAALRYQLIILRRRVRGRVRLTNGDRGGRQRS